MSSVLVISNTIQIICLANAQGHCIAADEREDVVAARLMP